jgi:hypothetical protein
MDSQPRRVLVGRKDRLNLAKAFCKRAGLHLVPHGRKRPIGIVAYYVEIPSGYSKERATRIARQIFVQRRRLELGHVRNQLLEFAASNRSPWQRARASREPPPWLRG